MIKFQSCSLISEAPVPIQLQDNDDSESINYFASVMIFNNREMLHKREVTFSDDVVDVVFAKLPYVMMTATATKDRTNQHN